MMSLGSGAGALGRVKVGFGNVIAEVEGVVAEPVPPPLALGHPVAESRLHATQRDRARAQLGDAAVVLESREQRQVEPGWFDHQFADLALALRTRRAVDDPQAGLRLTIAPGEGAAQDLEPGAHRE